MFHVFRTAFAAAVLLPCALAWSGLHAANPAYTIVTLDGQRLSVVELPKNTGKMTTFRTYPEGRLASLPSARIDWKATDAANVAPAPPGTPRPTPTPPGQGPRLSALAKDLGVDGARANTAGDVMKLKSGKAANMDETRPFFGEKSVLDHLAIGTLVFSASGCPLQRAVFAGSVTNKSRKKLRDLRGLVLLGERFTNRSTERIESFDPPNLAPGEEAQIFVYVSCDSAKTNSFVAILRDVSGTAQDVEKPGRENPFAPTPGPVRK